MSLLGLTLVFISVTLSAAAQTAFKSGVNRLDLAPDAGVMQQAMAFLTSPFVLTGLALYGVGTLLWLSALRHVDLSLVYPFVSISFVMVSISGIVFLNEPVQAQRVIGLALIIAGLLVMSRG